MPPGEGLPPRSSSASRSAACRAFSCRARVCSASCWRAEAAEDAVVAASRAASVSAAWASRSECRRGHCSVTSWGSRSTQSGRSASASTGASAMASARRARSVARRCCCPASSSAVRRRSRASQSSTPAIGGDVEQPLQHLAACLGGGAQEGREVALREQHHLAELLQAHAEDLAEHRSDVVVAVVLAHPGAAHPLVQDDAGRGLGLAGATLLRPHELGGAPHPEPAPRRR